MATIVAVRQYLRQIVIGAPAAGTPEPGLCRCLIEPMMFGLIFKKPLKEKMRRFLPRLAGCFAVAVFCLPGACAALQAQAQSQPQAQSQDAPVDEVFAAVPFDQWIKQGP